MDTKQHIHYNFTGKFMISSPLYMGVRDYSVRLVVDTFDLSNRKVHNFQAIK